MSEPQSLDAIKESLAILAKYDIHLAGYDFLVARVLELERQRYLPIPCTICSRERLMFTPTDGIVECEKCGHKWGGMFSE